MMLGKEIIKERRASGTDMQVSSRTGWNAGDDGVIHVLCQ